MTPVAVPRRGGGHDDPSAEGPFPSASAIRELVRGGQRDRALARMAPAMAEAYAAEEAAGRAPVLWETCERTVLARLRSMDRADFAALDQGREGLGNRLWRASREAPSLPAVLSQAKTKRYPMARLRRMTLWACLGMRPGEWTAPPYLRPLAANARGRALLGRMRASAGLPVLTRAAQIRGLPEEACRLFALEARAADLYALAYPDLSAAGGGEEWRAGPVLL